MYREHTNLEKVTVQAIEDLVKHLNENKSAFKKFMQVIKMNNEILRKYFAYVLADLHFKRTGKLFNPDEIPAKSISAVNGKVFHKKLSDQSGFAVMGCITKKHYDHSSVVHLELKSPARYREVYGNIYLFLGFGLRLARMGKYDNYSFVDEGDTILAVTGHFLDRYAERFVGKFLTRSEVIKKFAESLLLDKVKLIDNHRKKETYLFLKNRFDGQVSFGSGGMLISSIEETESKEKLVGAICFMKTLLNFDPTSKKHESLKAEFKLDDWKENHLAEDLEVLINSEKAIIGGKCCAYWDGKPVTDQNQFPDGVKPDTLAPGFAEFKF